MGFRSLILKRLFQKPWTEPYPKVKIPAPQGFRGRLVVDESLCRACGTCERICPSNAIQLEAGENEFLLKIYHEKCIRCGECVTKCPYNAMKFTEEFEFTSTQQSSVMSVARIPALRCSLCGRLFVSRAEAADILGTLAKELDYVKLICEDCRRQQAARIIALKK